MFTRVSGKGSKLAVATLLQKTVEVSKKYFPSHKKPYNRQSDTGFGISLYASCMSYLLMTEFFPALSTESAKSLGVLICRPSTCHSFMASLKDRSFGEDKFMIGLTLFLCTAAISGFAPKSANGGVSKGPATNPFFTQQGSIFRSENDIYSPPLLKIIFFPPLATCSFSTPIVAFLP